MTTDITSLLWIIGSSLLMCVLALAGVTTLSLSEKTMQRLLLPLVALSAGSLLGGAFFHMIPESLENALHREPVKFIYLVPTFQNPTGRTIPLERRQRIAEIIQA
ncbi:MAG: hypothetical protein JRF05_06670, partial [Deltaproteobacteria bacterium]|nr:hypothetical protein [Deltaproteobacteria bacterium]